MVQSRGGMVVGQVRVQVPWSVRSHWHTSLDAKLPVQQDRVITTSMLQVELQTFQKHKHRRLKDETINPPCRSLLRLARMGRHGLWHMDVVSVAVVGVHPVRVWRWPLMRPPAKKNKIHPFHQ